jgi:tetratricopeptide (TPR) repeat protein
LLAFLLPFLFQQGIVLDPAGVQYYQAVAAAPAEGLPGLVRKLDTICKSFPNSPSFPIIQETTLSLGILHPGLIPDPSERIQALKAANNSAMTGMLARIEIVQAYFREARQGGWEKASTSLSNPLLNGTLLQMQALADAALRSRDYAQAEALARRALEADPYSLLTANAHMALGLSFLYRGDAKSAMRHFRNAYAIYPGDTVYGNTREIMFSTWRFARPTPGAVAEIFDEMAGARLVPSTPLKEPLETIFFQGKCLLLDKEQMLTVAPDGKVLETKPMRKIEDIALARDGKLYSITEDRIDLGAGTPVPLSISIGGRPKNLDKLRSIAADERGDVYLLDQDTGILRGTISGAGLTLTLLSPMRGRLLRMDGRGHLFVVSADGKSIQIFAREGKIIGSIAPVQIPGKEPDVEHIALDALNHLYVLDGNTNSIQIYTILEGSAGFDKQRAGSMVLDQQPQYKNLKVIGVSASGEVYAVGKGEDSWIWLR